MPRTADKTDIPRRLTDAGQALFTRCGYNATGIQQITDEAGVPKGSFYNHFDSKEAFAAQIIHHYAAWVDEAWLQCLSTAPADALEAIRHILRRFIRHHHDTDCQGCLVGNFAAEVAASSPMCRDVLQSCMLAWRQRMAELIAQGQREGSLRDDVDAAALSALFWDAWEGALLRMKIARSVAPLEDTTELLLNHLLRKPHDTQ